MTAAEFFHDIVKCNYLQFMSNTRNRRLLWNAVVSMNTEAEYVALDRLGYSQVSRQMLDQASNQVRDSNSILSDLKYFAETFKHVRKIKDHPNLAAPFKTIATSTGISDHDLTTCKIDQHDLPEVLEKAFVTLSGLSELK